MPTSAQARQQQPARILVVEDDELLRELLGRALTEVGYAVSSACDGPEGRQALWDNHFDLALFDVWLPGVSGLELLDEAARSHNSMRVIVMTEDKTPETLLRAIKGEAFDYIQKPFEIAAVIDLVQRTLAADPVPRIEVVSARPNWVELLVPCDLQTAQRIQEVMACLAVDLPKDVREAIGQGFRELLTNAIEWGGKLDATRTVRIAYLRTPRMVQYRIADPGPGFCFDRLEHAAINNPEDDPLQHANVREQLGLRPGGLGLVMVRGLADELLYNERQNEVIFIKYVDQ